ncbi:hypothetical protein C0995_006510 [Termitomyces sp. Mi166|nr:hypothetical protein C0995_006510 [Termitomyces sp. Mi166\
MAIELEPTAPIVAPKTVMDPAPTPVSTTSSSTLLLTQEHSWWSVPCNKGKGKAKATEDDEDKESEATQKLRKELEDFVVPTKHIKLVQAAKAFLEQQDKSSQFFILEGYKGKRKAKALLGDSEQMGAK